MTRSEMLEKLETVNFEFIDPPSAWEDIGFTERPIWVNSKGYGYVMCDEHIECGECEEISEEKWKTIKEKINECALTIADIENTSLFDMVNDWLFDSLLDYRDTEEEPDEISAFFEGLKYLPNEAPKHLWWLEEPDGGYQPMFFCTEEAFNKAYERDWCDYSWAGLDDNMLEEWIKRLFEQ